MSAIKKIRILLTKHSDWASRLIYYLTGRKYTHASLGVDDSYYSFNFRGFQRETLESHRRRGVTHSIIWELQISEASYQWLCRQIHCFEQQKDRLHYTRIGVVFCLLHIPFHWEGHYFCSQFVAEMLKESGAVPLKKRPELYLPNHFLEELCESGQVVNVRVDPI